MSHSFDAKTVANISGPGVYFFWKGNRLLYIGATMYGLGRCFSPNHSMRKFFNDADVSLEFEPVADALEAFRIEAEAIAELKPEFNVETQREKQRRYKQRDRVRRCLIRKKVRDEAKRRGVSVYQLMNEGFHLKFGDSVIVAMS